MLWLGWGRLWCVHGEIFYCLWCLFHVLLPICRPLRYILSDVRDRLSNRGDTTWKRIVSGTVFLRFFCPAILSPSLFHLTSRKCYPSVCSTITDFIVVFMLAMFSGVFRYVHAILQNMQCRHTRTSPWFGQIPQSFWGDQISRLKIHTARTLYLHEKLIQGPLSCHAPLAEYPNDKACRRLTLVAKVIQNLANATRFGVKENYMAFVNDFMDKEMPTMDIYLNQVSVRQNSWITVFIILTARTWQVYCCFLFVLFYLVLCARSCWESIFATVVSNSRYSLYINLMIAWAGRSLGPHLVDDTPYGIGDACWSDLEFERKQILVVLWRSSSHQFVVAVHLFIVVDRQHCLVTCVRPRNTMRKLEKSLRSVGLLALFIFSPVNFSLSLSLCRPCPLFLPEYDWILAYPGEMWCGLTCAADGVWSAGYGSAQC